MEIIICRHAESIANTEGIFQGQSYDTELSDLGKKQSKALAKSLSNIKFNQIIASPLKRTYQTALQITKTLLLPDPQTDNRLLEINHGDWENKSVEQIETQFPGQLETWKNDPGNITMPNGENIEQVYDRAKNFIQELTKQDHNRVIIVSHDAVIRIILTKILMRETKDMWIYELDAAGYSTINWTDKLKHVVKINENEHLTGITSDLSQHAL